MNLVADILSGLSSMAIVIIIGFILVVAFMTLIAKKL